MHMLLLDMICITLLHCFKHFFSCFLWTIFLNQQIVVWRYLHTLDGPDVPSTKNALVWVVLFQYIPRLLRIFPVTKDLKRTAGVFIETAWLGAAYYLLWFMLAGHVSACMYLQLLVSSSGGHYQNVILFSFFYDMMRTWTINRVDFWLLHCLRILYSCLGLVALNSTLRNFLYLLD